MKRALSILVLACLLVAPLQLFALPTVINSSGQQLLSIFDGLKPSPISQSALRGVPSPFDMAHLSAHLSGMPKGFFIIGGGNCPNGGLCSPEDLHIPWALFRENVTNPILTSRATSKTS